MNSFKQQKINMPEVLEQSTKDASKKLNFSIFQVAIGFIISKNLHLIVTFILCFLLFALLSIFNQNLAVEVFQNKSFIQHAISNFNAITGNELNVSEYRGILVFEIQKNQTG